MAGLFTKKPSHSSKSAPGNHSSSSPSNTSPSSSYPNLADFHSTPHIRPTDYSIHDLPIPLDPALEQWIQTHPEQVETVVFSNVHIPKFLSYLEPVGLSAPTSSIPHTSHALPHTTSTITSPSIPLLPAPALSATTMLPSTAAAALHIYTTAAAAHNSTAAAVATSSATPLLDPHPIHHILPIHHIPHTVANPHSLPHSLEQEFETGPSPANMASPPRSSAPSVPVISLPPSPFLVQVPMHLDTPARRALRKATRISQKSTAAPSSSSVTLRSKRKLHIEDITDKAATDKRGKLTSHSDSPSAEVSNYLAADVSDELDVSMAEAGFGVQLRQTP